MNNFAERLKELRKEELTQKQLAKYLNVNYRTVSSWEAGTRQPDYEILISLCKYFDVSADYLLGLTD